MVDIIQRLKNYFLQESDKVTFVRTENGNHFFTLYNDLQDEYTYATCIPFTNDDNEEGYTIQGERKNHKFMIATIFKNEL